MTIRLERLIIVSMILISALLVSGVSAVRIISFDMDIAENGDTTLDIGYDLSFPEVIAYYTKLADPTAALQDAIEQSTDQDVTVLETTASKSSLFVPGLITPESSSAGTTYTTPAIDFSKAEETLKGYWFASFVTIDFMPAFISITFPDGYTENIGSSYTIPSITHTV